MSKTLKDKFLTPECNSKCRSKKDAKKLINVITRSSGTFYFYDYFRSINLIIHKWEGVIYFVTTVRKPYYLKAWQEGAGCQKYPKMCVIIDRPLSCNIKDFFFPSNVFFLPWNRKLYSFRKLIKMLTIFRRS